MESRRGRSSARSAPAVHRPGAPALRGRRATGSLTAVRGAGVEGEGLLRRPCWTPDRWAAIATCAPSLWSTLSLAGLATMPTRGETVACVPPREIVRGPSGTASAPPAHRLDGPACVGCLDLRVLQPLELLDRRLDDPGRARTGFEWIEGWYNPRRRHTSIGISACSVRKEAHRPPPRQARTLSTIACPENRWSGSHPDGRPVDGRSLRPLNGDPRNHLRIDGTPVVPVEAAIRSHEHPPGSGDRLAGTASVCGCSAGAPRHARLIRGPAAVPHLAERRPRWRCAGLVGKDGRGSAVSASASERGSAQGEPLRPLDTPRSAAASATSCLPEWLGAQVCLLTALSRRHSLPSYRGKVGVRSVS